MAFKLMTDDDLMRVRTPATMREFSDPGAAQQRAFSARKIMADTGYDTGSMAPVERSSYERKIMDLSAQEQMRSQEQRTRDQFVEPARIQGRALVDAARFNMMGDVGAAAAGAVQPAAEPPYKALPSGKGVYDERTGQVMVIPEQTQPKMEPSVKPTGIQDYYWITLPDGSMKVEYMGPRQNSFGMPPAPQAGGAAGTSGTEGTPAGATAGGQAKPTDQGGATQGAKVGRFYSSAKKKWYSRASDGTVTWE